jgi:hypothetical protein
MDCNPKPSIGHSRRKNHEQYHVCPDYGMEFIKDTFSRQIYLNVALKRQLRVLPNLSDAVFGMGYGKHAMSPEVTLARCWGTGQPTA